MTITAQISFVRKRRHTDPGQRIVAVCRLLDGEALLFEKPAMRREPLELVIHPEDTLGARHRAGKLVPLVNPGNAPVALPAC